MSASGLLVVKDTRALSDVVGTDAAPGDCSGVSLMEDIDLLAIDFDAAIDFLDSALESTYNCKMTSSGLMLKFDQISLDLP